MATKQIKIGDRVLFHYIEAHICGGENCECDQKAPRETRNATVTGFADEDDPTALTLNVEFSDEEIAIHGWCKDQSCARKATREPPESGTWTPS